MTNPQQYSAKRHLPALTRLAGAGLLAIGLAACAEDGGTTGSDSATGGAPAQADQSVQNIPQLANCAPPANGNLFLNIAGRSVVIPQAEIRGVLTTSDNPADPPKSTLFERVAPGTGCPANPVPTLDVRIENVPPHPALAGLMTMNAGSARALEGFARITRELISKRPEPACRRAGEGVLDCRGEETIGGRKINVLYLISTRPQHQTAFGAPITARCIVDQQQLLGCSMTDIVADGVTFDVQIAKLEPDADKLAAAHAAAVKKAQSYLR